MTILLLKGYNNYFNRIVKQEESVSAYIEASTSYLEYSDVNFDPQDGIMTSLIVGGPTQQERVIIPSPGHPSIRYKVLKFDEGGSPDYLVCHKNTSDSDEIISRWFVTECVKIRQGQYKLALKRDVLVDFNKNILEAPCFVEKGTISDASDALLLNSEGMKFNQIKNSEEFIKDKTKCAWLIGYVKKNIDSNDLQNINPINYTSPTASANIPDAEDYLWEDCIQYFDTEGQLVNNSHKDCYYFYNTDVSFRTWYNPSNISILAGNARTTFTENYQLLYNSTEFGNGDWEGLTSTAFDISETHKVSDGEAASISRKIFETTRDDETVRNLFNIMLNSAKTIQFGGNTIMVDEDIFKYNGQQIVKNNRVYRLEVSAGEYKEYSQYSTGMDNNAVAWMTAVGNTITYLDYNSDNPTKRKIRFNFRGKQYQIIAREVILDQTVSFNFPASASRNGCIDATYDMFAMPVDPKSLGLSVSSDDVMVVFGDVSDNKFMNLPAISDTQLTLATILSTKLGAGSNGALNYDLQLLPYCPFNDDELNIYVETQIYGPTYGKTVIDITNLESTDYTLIYNNEETPKAVGIILYPKRANFSKGIDFVIPNESVHYGWQEVTNPTLLAQGTQDGLPVYRFARFPYKVTDDTWEIGPNLNNSNVDVELSDGLTLDECEYTSLYVSSGLGTPVLLLTSTEFPTPPAGQEYSYTFTGDFTIKVRAHWVLPDTPEDIKVKNECDMYRLSSPNFTAMYEFKKTKLRDGLKAFNIDCTYKPFTPYIKVNPNYDNSLYAVQDFNDSMGLMLNGDFSIPMLSDAWVNYELQNRNYQAIFNRQIENLDVNQQIASEQQQFQGIVGMITGGIGGAGAGAYAGFKASGSPWGAAAGAVIGGVGGTALSAVGYDKDRDWLTRQQAENRSFAIDQFNYQLGNTQALNPTITKSTPLTYNNKVWPILEHYTCTDREKSVLKDKIKYNGMTIMAIGKLADYMVPGGYLKGKLIRLNDLNDDSHVANAIYEEVDKGFYEGE